MFRYFRFLSITIFVLIPAFEISAQSVSIKTEMDTHKIDLGGRALLSYVIETDLGQKIIFPPIGDTLISTIEVIVPPVVDSLILDNERIRLKQQMELTSFEEGNHFIPPQPFTIVIGRRQDTIYSHASYLEVEGFSLDTTGVIRDIAGIERAPLIFRDFLPILILLLIVVIALAIVHFIKRKKGKGVFILPEKPADPPHVIALRELDKLKAQKLWQQQQTKEYYSKLTFIIRTYLEDTFGILALEKPTSEILTELRNFDQTKSVDNRSLERLLNLADLIKFAKGQADPEENMEHLDNAYSLVKSIHAAVRTTESENTKNDVEV